MEYESGAVHPTKTISEGWELLEKNYWLFFGMTLLMALIVIAVALVLGTAISMVSLVLSRSLGVVSADVPEAGNVYAALIPQLIEQGLSVITTLVTTLISAMMTCGIYLAFSRESKGEAPEFGDLFAGIRFFVPCLIVSLIMTAIHFLINIAILLIGLAFGIASFGADALITPDGRPDPRIFQTLFAVIAVIGLFYLVAWLVIGALTFFIYQLIAVKNLSAANALGRSFRAGLSNLFGIIGLLILEGLMALAGALLCGVGILFILPIIMAANYTAYLRVFGKPDNVAEHLPPPPPIFNT